MEKAQDGEGGPAVAGPFWQSHGVTGGNGNNVAESCQSKLHFSSRCPTLAGLINVIWVQKKQPCVHCEGEGGLSVCPPPQGC